jgi:hypothetical protein
MAWPFSDSFFDFCSAIPTDCLGDVAHQTHGVVVAREQPLRHAADEQSCDHLSPVVEYRRSDAVRPLRLGDRNSRGDCLVEQVPQDLAVGCDGTGGAVRCCSAKKSFPLHHRAQKPGWPVERRIPPVGKDSPKRRLWIRTSSPSIPPYRRAFLSKCTGMRSHRLHRGASGAPAGKAPAHSAGCPVLGRAVGKSRPRRTLPR